MKRIELAELQKWHSRRGKIGYHIFFIIPNKGAGSLCYRVKIKDPVMSNSFIMLDIKNAFKKKGAKSGITVKRSKECL